MASYTTSLFRDITAKPALLLERTGQPQHRGIYPLLFSNSVWVLSRPTGNSVINRMKDICETGPTVYSPYPRTCRWNYKGSTFSSVTLRSWVLIRPVFEPATSHMTARCSTNRATGAGADPGEVKWVNFHPHFLSPPSSFFFLSLKYWNNIWFLWFLWLRWKMCISDNWFYQSIDSFWAHKHTVQHVIQKRLVSML